MYFQISLFFNFFCRFQYTGYFRKGKIIGAENSLQGYQHYHGYPGLRIGEGLTTKRHEQFGR
jgi:hypothetical protein